MKFLSVCVDLIKMVWFCHRLLKRGLEQQCAYMMVSEPAILFQRNSI